MSAAAPWVLPWIAFLAVWMLLCPVAFGLHRLARGRLAALAPSERSTLLLALAALPVSVAALVALLGFMPAVGGFIVDYHCHADTGCGPHVPILHDGAPYAMTFGALLLATALALCGGVLRRLRRTQRLANALGSLAEPEPRQPYEIVTSAECFAYCIGLWRPKVVVSTGLIRRLSSQELDAVVAHEHAHAARRDNLRHGLAALGLLPLGPRARRKLLADLSLASEQACDLIAAERSGSTSLLSALATLQPTSRARAAASAAFEAPATIASRVAALAPESAVSNAAAYSVSATIAAGYACCTLVTTYLAHHGSEVLLAWLG